MQNRTRQLLRLHASDVAATCLPKIYGGSPENAYNSLTNFEYEVNEMTGNGNWINLLKLACKKIVESHHLKLFLVDLSLLQPLCSGCWGCPVARATLRLLGRSRLLPTEMGMLRAVGPACSEATFNVLYKNSLFRTFLYSPAIEWIAFNLTLQGPGSQMNPVFGRPYVRKFIKISYWLFNHAYLGYFLHPFSTLAAEISKKIMGFLKE